MNGFELPENILKKQLDHIRKERKQVDLIIGELQNLPSYQLRSEDAQYLLAGWGKIKRELAYMLRYNYDADNK